MQESFALLGAISGDTLVQAVIWVVVAGVIFFLLGWLIDYVAVGEPFNKVAKIIVAVAAVIVLINALLTLAGKPFINW